MKLHLLSALLFLVFSTISAQDEALINMPEEDFLYLNDSTLLFSPDFTAKRGFIKTNFFDANGDKILFEQIKFYNYGGKHLAHYNADLLPRIETGYYNVFEATSYNSEGSGRGSYATKSFYFSRAPFGDLQPLNYNTLTEVLSIPNPQIDQRELSLIKETLESGKQKQKKKLLLIGTGLGTMTIGGILMNQDSRDSRIAGLAVVTTGLITVVSAVTVKKPFHHHLSAVRQYNRFYLD